MRAVTMLKIFRYCAVGVLSSVAPTIAYATEVPVYDGTTKITKVNSKCIADGYSVGDGPQMTLRIKARPSTKAGGGIAFGPGGRGFNYQLDTGESIGAGTSSGVFNGTGLSSQVGVATFQVPYTITIKPTVITDQTTKVTFTAVMNNFFATKGCKVTITFSGNKRG